MENTDKRTILNMEIIENSREYLDDFVRLNEEWISNYFELEQVDHDLARNPGKIIDEGGYIFIAISNGLAVGTCALFNDGNGVYELARMAVSPSSQNIGFGKSLIEVCLSKLSEICAKKVYLVSNTKLEAAITLYRSSGFETVFEGKHPIYARANIVMEREFP